MNPLHLVVLTVVLVPAAAACSPVADGAAGDTPSPAVTSPVTAADTPPVATTVPVASVPVTTSPVATAPPVATVPGSTVPVATAPTPCDPIPTGLSEITVTAGGYDYPVRIFVPSGLDGEPIPAVVAWHGLGSNGDQQAVFSGYETLAEAEGFLVVHPTGLAIGDAGPASWQLTDPGTSRDDLRFAHDLIDRLIDDWCADGTRIYSTGMSNGGYFTARLVCEMSDRIAAAVSVAATFHPDDCAPERAVPYTAYHGTDDVVVPFDGSGESVLLGDAAPPELTELFRRVMPDEVAEFAADAGCAFETPETIGDDVTALTYTGCDRDVEIRFVEIAGGGHTWPGSPIADSLGGGFGYTTDTVDATADGWAFMSRYRLDP